LSSRAKEEITHLAQVTEPDTVRIPAHVSKEIFDAGYAEMVPLLVSLSS
jgi:hypothetical protein